MDGQEKALLKDAVRSLRPTEDVQAASVNSKAVVKRAAKLAEERGIVESRKKARKHLRQFPEAERYIQKQVLKFLAQENKRSDGNVKRGNSRERTAPERTPSGNHIQVDGHRHVAKGEFAWVGSQTSKHKLPKLAAKAAKKRKRDVLSQPVEDNAQAEETSTVKEPHGQDGCRCIFGRGSWKEDSHRTDVKKGPFSNAEDEALLAAVRQYADKHELPQEDLFWVWKIGAVLPQRTLHAIYRPLVKLTHPGHYEGKWTEAEKQKLMELHKILGNDWVQIGERMGRPPLTCALQISELTTSAEVHNGPWTMEETQLLEYLCHRQMQSNNESGSRKVIFKEGLTRDGIDWTTISREIGTRSPSQCRNKWYQSLRPSMKATGLWGEREDTELLEELLARKHLSETEVAWGNLIEGRSKLITRERWGTMRSKIPGSRRFEFNQQVMYLIARFRPKLLKNAGSSGPYGVSAEDAAAAKAAKKNGTVQERSEIADRIAAAAQ